MGQLNPTQPKPHLACLFVSSTCRDPKGEQNHEGYEPQKEQFLNFDFMSISLENTTL